jgi:hypothetical protein
VSEKDLFELAEWKRQDPDVPDGDWYKDFGTFKLCDTGKYPSSSSWPASQRGESGRDRLAEHPYRNLR